MITAKATRCARFAWAYVTRYPYVSAKDIAGAQLDYGHQEVLAALAALEAAGLVERDKDNPSGWHALIPFVMIVPAWAI